MSLGSEQGSIERPSPRANQFPPSPTPAPSTRYSGADTTNPQVSRPSPAADARLQYTTSEDDAHLQTLCRMSEKETAVLSPASGSAVEPTRRVFEYYSDFNALSLLNEAIGRPTRRRLVPVDLGGPQTGSVVHRELSRLDDIDREYLAQRRVHELPSKQSWLVLSLLEIGIS